MESYVTELCLDVQTAVAKQLQRDLEVNGVQVPASLSESSAWRDVFARQHQELPPSAAAIVRGGTDRSVFRAVEH